MPGWFTLIVNHTPISIQARSTCTYKVQAHRWELSFSLIRYTQSIEVSLHLHVQISFIVHQLEKMRADATLNILLYGKVCKLGAHKMMHIINLLHIHHTISILVSRVCVSHKTVRSWDHHTVFWYAYCWMKSMQVSWSVKSDNKINNDTEIILCARCFPLSAWKWQKLHLWSHWLEYQSGV